MSRVARRGYTMNMAKTYGLIIVALILATTACSDGGGSKSDDTVWKGQTRALDKAKQVEQTVLQDADRQRKEIEQQSQ